MRVLRVYHGGRIASHRARERALVAAGVDVTLVAPANWGEGSAPELAGDPFPTIELTVKRAGDVNRHAYVSPAEMHARRLQRCARTCSTCTRSRSASPRGSG